MNFWKIQSIFTKYYILKWNRGFKNFSKLNFGVCFRIQVKSAYKVRDDYSHNDVDYYGNIDNMTCQMAWSTMERSTLVPRSTLFQQAH